MTEPKETLFRNRSDSDILEEPDARYTARSVLRTVTGYEAVVECGGLLSRAYSAGESPKLGDALPVKAARGDAPRYRVFYVRNAMPEPKAFAVLGIPFPGEDGGYQATCGLNGVFEAGVWDSQRLVARLLNAGGGVTSERLAKRLQLEIERAVRAIVADALRQDGLAGTRARLSALSGAARDALQPEFDALGMSLKRLELLYLQAPDEGADEAAGGVTQQELAAWVARAAASPSLTKAEAARLDALEKRLASDDALALQGDAEDAVQLLRELGDVAALGDRALLRRYLTAIEAACGF